MLIISVILRNFFDIFRNFYALLSSTYLNFELDIVILSLVPRFLNKSKTQLLSTKKVETIAGNKEQLELKTFSKEEKNKHTYYRSKI